MAENFDLIFGQNASQQYAWNDTDYQNGWETIGNIPPTAVQFDALQRRADMKSQELNSRLITVEASIAGGAGQKREADTTYAVGDVVSYDGLPMDWVLVCIVDGTSGSADITLPSPRVEGARILDGTVTWALRKIATYGGIGYRQSSTACPIGSIAFSTALPAGWYLEATTGGTTSASDLVITSPTVGGTVTDGTVVWTIRSLSAVATTTDKGLLSPTDKSKIDNLPASGGTGFNHREVITTSGTWTAPTSGYYKVTCIGGGGAGGSRNTRGGQGGGITSFGSYLSAIGGGGGGGATGLSGGGGGGAGKVNVAYISLTADANVACTVGAGGVISTVANTDPTGEDAGRNSTGGYVAALAAKGAGNGINGMAPSGGYFSGCGGVGASNGTGYGGGGGGAAGETKQGVGVEGRGADNGYDAQAYNVGGDGGNGGDGAIIIEYYLNA